MVAVTGNVGLGGPNDSLLFSETHGILRRSVRMTCFHFNENQLIAIPRDKIHFAFRGTVTGRNDPESQRSQVGGAFDLGFSSKRN